MGSVQDAAIDLTDLKLSLNCKSEHAVSHAGRAELLGHPASSQESQPNSTVHPSYYLLAVGGELDRFRNRQPIVKNVTTLSLYLYDTDTKEVRDAVLSQVSTSPIANDQQPSTVAMLTKNQCHVSAPTIVSIYQHQGQCRNHNNFRYHFQYLSYSRHTMVPGTSS